MDFIPLAIGALYFLLVFGLSTLLLVRGVTHIFVGLFACGAFLHLLQSLGFVFLRQAPGGFGANARFFPILGAVGALGTIVLAAGFVSLTMFLLRDKTP